MPQALTRLAATALLALAAAWGNAQTGNWGDVTIVSGTVGNNSNRLCMGVPDYMRPADIGCPTYAPSLSTAGHVSITGNVSANKFIGDGSGLSNLSVSGDRIVSDTHAVIVHEGTGYVSLTTTGSTWGYLSSGWSYLANLFANTVSSSLVSATYVSATYVDATRNGTVSGTYGYFRHISGTNIHGTFTGDGSGLTGIGQGDRIVSGTTNAIAWQDRSLTITTAGAQRMVVGENGNVGIGTAVPTALLEVSGSVAKIKLNDTSGLFGGGIVFQNSGVSNWTLGGGNDSVDQASLGFINVTNQLVLNLKQNGTVGVGGVASPTATLQVSGTFTVSTSAQAATRPSVFVGADGNVGVGTNTPSATLTVMANRQQLILSTPDTRKQLLLQYDTSSNTATIGIEDGYSVADIVFRNNAADRMRLTSAGRLGIGVSSPSSSLHVLGEAQVGSSGAACTSTNNAGAIRYSGGTLYYCNASNTWTALGTSAGVTGTGSATAVAYWSGANSLTYDTDGFYWDASNNRLGIGTNAPQYSLDISNSVSGGGVRVYTGGNLAGGFVVSSSASSLALGIAGIGGHYSGASQPGDGVLRQLTSGSLIISSRGSGELKFATGVSNDVERVRITSSGNVGIATQSATATLQVSGSFVVSVTGQTEPSLFVDVDGRVGVRANSARQAMLTVGPHTVVAAPASSLMVKEAGGAIGNTANSYVYPAELQYQTSGGNTARLLMSGYRRDAGTLWTGTGYRLQYGVDNSFTAGERAYIELGSTVNGDGRIILGLHSADRLIITTNTIVASGTVSVTDAIQVGSSNLSCSSGIPGAIRYNSPNLQFCNGTSWTNIGGGGGGTVTGTGSATAVAFWNGGSALSYDTDGFYWDATNNRLGIGTNTPSVTLNLVANQVGAGTMRAMNLNTQGYAGITLGSLTNESVGTFTYGNANAFLFPNAVWVGTRSNTVPMVFTANGSDAEDMRLSNGRLGIGTSSATATLQVSGSFTVSNSNQQTSPTLHATVGGRVGIATSNPWEMAHIGNEGVGGRLWIGEDNATRRGLLIAATVANEVSGSTYPPFVRMTAFNYGSNKSLPFVINPHGTEGFVSIGKFDPKAMLDVQGTISASNAIQVGQSSLLCSSPISGSIRYNTTSDTLQICTGSGWKSLVSGTTGGGGGLTGTGSATAVAFWNGASALSYDSGLYWDNINKRLGVGTVTPLRGLEVKQANDDVLSGFGVANAAANSRVSLWLKNGTGHLWSGGSGQSPLVLNAGGGLVGIGTESPTAALQVSGSFIVSTSAQDITPSFYVGADGKVGVGTRAPVGRMEIVQDIGGENALTLTQGNAGVNAARIDLRKSRGTPSAPSAVLANDNIGILLVSGYDGTTFGTTGSAQILFQAEKNFDGSTRDTAISFNSVQGTTNSEKMRITAAGNIGIGTSQPLATLSVSGTISATNAIQVGQSSLVCANPISGSIRYSAASSTIQVCNGTAWVGLGSGGGVSLATLTDVNITNLAGRDYLRHDFATSKWVNISESTVMSTTTMVNGAPDAIICVASGIDEPLYLTGSVGGHVYYRRLMNTGGDGWIQYSASTGAYINHSGMSTFDCVTGPLTLNQLYTSGRAFNFIGNSGASGGNALGDRITSGTLAMVANSATSYVSLSSNGTTWGYLNSGNSYLPTLTAGRVSATNVSATYIQLNSPTTVLACNAGFTGAMRYTSGTMQVCDGSNWGNIGIGVPTGTIAAFAAASCPNGWSEYTASRGRFLRGIDNGAGIDPAGTRAAGNTQDDAMQRITGQMGRVMHANDSNSGAFSQVNLISNNLGGGTARNHVLIDFDSANSPNARTATETRPSNVAVTFCMYSGFQSAPGQTILTTLASLTDVSIAGATTGQVLAYNGSSWVASNTSAGGGTALGDRITSGTVSVTVNTDGYISLTTGVTDWGYLSSGNSYLPTLVAGRVSSTNISATMIQVGASGDTCGVGLTGGIRYNSVSNTLQVCTGASGWQSLASGTASAGMSALASLTDVSASSPLANQILRYNASKTKWEAVSASDAVFSCPSGYALVSAAGRAYGCIKTTENAAASCATHINTCMADGARLPTLSEFKMAKTQYGYTVTNYAYLENAAGDNDCAGITSAGRPYGIGDTGSYPARCFIPAVGIISSTGSTALGDRITSGTVSVTTNANGYISLTTGVTDWGYLSSGNSYLPTLVASRISSTNISGTLIQVGQSAATCSSGISGSIRYNTTSNTVQFCNGTGWASLASGTTGGASALSGLTDVQLTNLAARDHLRYDSVSSKWVNISESTVMSTTTMIPDWPDAIICNVTNPSWGPTAFYPAIMPYTGGDSLYHYRANIQSGAIYAVRYNSSGAFASYAGITTTDCNTSISSLYSSGKAFNFIGNAATGGGALGDRITSGTVSVTVNTNGYISLTSGVTDWGYLSSGNSYLPSFRSTNISASSAIQVGSNSLTCVSGISGSIRYSQISSTMEYCNSTAWVSMGPSGTQPISFKATNGSAQSFSANTTTKLNFATEEFDTNNNFASSRFTATVPGKYLFTASALLTGVTGGADIYIFKNGTYSGIGSAINGNVTKSGLSASGVLDLAVNDYVEVYGWVGSGSPVHYQSYNQFSGVLLSPQDSGGGGAGALNDLTDVDTSGAATGSIIAYNGANWVVSSTASSTALGDRITSGTVSVTVNTNGYISLTTGGTDWGYLSSGLSYLPTLVASRVSATNVSATTIHATGNVGIGTTSPSAKLDVTSRQDLDNLKAVVLSNASTDWTSVSKSVSLVFTRTPAGNIETHDYGEIRGGIESGDGAQGYLSFWSGGGGNRSEKMRIMHNGRVGIGTTAPSTTLYVNGGQIAGGFGAIATTGVLDFNDVSNARSGNGYTLLRGSTAANAPNTSTNYWQTLNFEYGASKLGDGNITQLAVPYSAGASIAESMYMRGRYSGTWSGWYKFIISDPSGSAVVANNLTAAAFLYSSDRRLKENIVPLTGGLAKLESITPVMFRFVSDTMHSIRLGVIAQEVEKVYPQAVITGSDGYKKVDYPALVPVVIDAVKELNAENRKLREEVRSLQAANVLLKAANGNFDARLNVLEQKMAR